MKKVLFWFVCILAFGTRCKASGEYLSISNVTSSSFTIDWSALEPAIVKYNGYTLKGYKLNVGGTVYELGPSVISYTATGLAPGTEYWVDVYAVYDDALTTDATFFDWTSVTTLGTGSNAYLTSTYVSDVTSNPGITDASVSELPSSVPAVSLATPVIADIAMEGTKIGLRVSGYGSIDGLECAIYSKAGKLVDTKTSISSNVFYFYGVKANSAYYAVVRGYAYNENYEKVYSAWSAKKWVLAQPTISTSKKKLKIEKSSITFSWNKVKGASSYVVYARKRNAKKWVKVGTTKKTKWVLTKIKGKMINCNSNNYEITVVAKGKAGGKKLTSARYGYVYTYRYFTY